VASPTPGGDQGGSAWDSTGRGAIRLPQQRTPNALPHSAFFA